MRPYRNGSTIGLDNPPTSASASGVWLIRDVPDFAREGKWPGSALLSWDPATAHANITLTNNNLDAEGTGTNQNVYTQAFDPTLPNLYMEFQWMEAPVANSGVGIKDDTTEDLEIGNWSGEKAGIGRRGGGGGSRMNWYMNIEGQSESAQADSFASSPPINTRHGIYIDSGDVWVHEDGTWMDVTLQTDPDNSLNPRNSTSITGTTWYFGCNPESARLRLIPSPADWLHAPAGAVAIRV